jgi:hypothetical protein
MLANCPLRYEGNRGSAVVDVLGTAALSVLCGHWRYAHINSVRGDTLNPPLLGMSGTVSEDVVRRAMKRIDPKAWLGWSDSIANEPMRKTSTTNSRTSGAGMAIPPKPSTRAD